MLVILIASVYIVVASIVSHQKTLLPARGSVENGHMLDVPIWVPVDSLCVNCVSIRLITDVTNFSFLFFDYFYFKWPVSI